MSLLVQDALLQGKLSCSICNHPISFGPVTKSSRGYQCGRCSNANTERNDIYEALARNHVFPCKNKSAGCEILSPFGIESKNHEIFCAKQFYSCSSISSLKCQWKGNFDEIEDHIKDAHEDILIEDLKLELDTKKLNSLTRFLYFYENSTIIIIHLCHTNDNGLYVKLYKLTGNGNVVLDEKYHLTVTCEQKKAIMMFSKNVNYNLHDSITDLNDNLLDYVFINYMSTPEKKLMLSFQVQFKLPVTEQTTSYMLTCKHRPFGCSYMGYKSDVEKHEDACILYNCPVAHQFCEWRGVISGVSKHCECLNDIFECTAHVHLYPLEFLERFYILKSDSLRCSFRICVKLHQPVDETENLVFQLAVQYIGDAVDAKNFIFDVTFCDDNFRSNNYKIVESKKSFPCVPFTSIENAFNNVIEFSYEGLQFSTAMLIVRSVEN